MYVGVGGGAAAVRARSRGNDNVRAAPAATVAGSWLDPDERLGGHARVLVLRLLRPAVLVRQLRLRPAGSRRRHRLPLGRQPVQREQLRPGTGRSNGRGVLLSTNAGVQLHGHDRRRLGSALSGASCTRITTRSSRTRRTGGSSSTSVTAGSSARTATSSTTRATASIRRATSDRSSRSVGSMLSRDSRSGSRR